MDALDIVRAASVPALATDESDRVLAFNDAAQRLLGPSAESILGRSFHRELETRDVFGNRLFDGAGIHDMVRRGEPIRAFEMDVSRASGRRLRMRVSVLPVIGPETDRYRLVYHLIPRRRRSRAEEAIDLLLKNGNGAPAPARGVDGPQAKALTGREQQVLRHLASGQDNGEIATELNVSVNTVRSHIRNILRKTEAHSRAEAISVAFYRGLL